MRRQEKEIRNINRELYLAYIKCSKRKRKTEQQQAFSLNLCNSLLELRNSIINGNYSPLPSYAFLVRKPVLREVFAPVFRDRVYQTAVAGKLEPLFEKLFIYDCYSCRKGRGTLFGNKRLKRFIAQCSAGHTRDCYILQCDLQGYFMSIDRRKLWDRLKEFLDEKYKGQDREIFYSMVKQTAMESAMDNAVIKGERKEWINLPDNKSLFCAAGSVKPNLFAGNYSKEMDLTSKGLAIGKLTSQMFGNFWLSPFDHWCKHTLKLRFYGRYVDDFFVVHTDKKFLINLVTQFRKYLNSLGLTLHPKKNKITYYKKGVDFLGTRIKANAILPGKRIKKGFNALLHEINNFNIEKKYDENLMNKTATRMNSYLGMLKQYNSKEFIRNALKKSQRIFLFFDFQELNKVIPKYKTLDKMYRITWKTAIRKYRKQFKKSVRDNIRKPPFLSKEILYNKTYKELWGIYPENPIKLSYNQF